MGKGRFFVSVTAGAAIGATLALMDAGTRREMGIWGKYLLSLAQDPEQLTSSSRELIDRATTTAHKINEDVSFIKEKVDDLKDLKPEIQEIVSETKETISPTNPGQTSSTSTSVGKTGSAGTSVGKTGSTSTSTSVGKTGSGPATNSNFQS